MEGPSPDAHIQAGDEVWSTSNTNLTFSGTNMLFAAAIVINVFLTVWVTRGIRIYADLTGCCKLAVGMSILSLSYFVTANVLLVGIGVNTTAGRCTGISIFMLSFYLIVKAYTGIFLFKKLREMSDMLRPGRNPMSKRIRAKKSYYFVFGPLVLIFTACATLVFTYINTSIQQQPEGRPYCVIQIVLPRTILPVFLFSTLVIAFVFSFTFITPSNLFSRKIVSHPSSTSACFASLITAIIPFVTIACFFTMHGHESASLIGLSCGIDVMVALLAVWYMEGSWTEDREKVCKCDKPLPALNARLETETGFMGASTVEKYSVVKKLHTQTGDLVKAKNKEAQD